MATTTLRSPYAYIDMINSSQNLTLQEMEARVLAILEQPVRFSYDGKQVHILNNNSYFEVGSDIVKVIRGE